MQLKRIGRWSVNLGEQIIAGQFRIMEIETPHRHWRQCGKLISAELVHLCSSYCGQLYNYPIGDRTIIVGRKPPLGRLEINIPIVQ